MNSDLAVTPWRVVAVGVLLLAVSPGGISA
jgi:hypothetical protein